MPDFLTTRQAALYLGVSHRWVQLLIRRGLLDAEDEVRARRVSLAACDAYRFGGTVEHTTVSLADQFDAGSVLGELVAHFGEVVKDLAPARIPAGLQEEIQDAGAHLAQLLFKARDLQKRPRTII